MITLYGAARVPYTEKVRRALLYKKLDFELHEPTCPEDYQRWNPKSGMLPALDLDGELIEDSTQILIALDARFPDPPLLSPDPMVASQQRQLEDWADESFLWYWMKYRRMLGGGEMPLPLKGEGPDPPRSEAARSSRLRRLRAWLRAGGTWERPITGLQRELGLRMDDLVNFLGTRPFFYADRLSMADLSVYAMLSTMRRDSIPGSARLLAERPSLVAFMARVEEVTGGAGSA
jgi:glutathione S-transferase